MYIWRENIAFVNYFFVFHFYHVIYRFSPENIRFVMHLAFVNNWNINYRFSHSNISIQKILKFQTFHWISVHSSPLQPNSRGNAPNVMKYYTLSWQENWMQYSKDMMLALFDTPNIYHKKSFCVHLNLDR